MCGVKPRTSMLDAQRLTFVQIAYMEADFGETHPCNIKALSNRGFSIDNDVYFTYHEVL